MAAVVFVTKGRRTLLVALVLVNLAATAIVGGSVPGELEVPKLKELANLVWSGEGRPTAEQVLEAYKEYVHLYDLQSNLANDFQGAVGEKMDFEAKYESISAVLKTAPIISLAEDLFGVFAGLERAQLVMTEPLRERIEQAIENMYDQQ